MCGGAHSDNSSSTRISRHSWTEQGAFQHGLTWWITSTKYYGGILRSNPTLGIAWIGRPSRAANNVRQNTECPHAHLGPSLALCNTFNGYVARYSVQPAVE